MAGIYVIDLDRSIAAIPTGGITPSAAADRDARLRAAFAADAYALDIRPHGTFELTVRRGAVEHVISGTCTASETAVGLTMTTLDGTEVQESDRTIDIVLRHGDALVLSDAGRSIYLARR